MLRYSTPPSACTCKIVDFSFKLHRLCYFCVGGEPVASPRGGRKRQRQLELHSTPRGSYQGQDWRVYRYKCTHTVQTPAGTNSGRSTRTSKLFWSTEQEKTDVVTSHLWFYWGQNPYLKKENWESKLLWTFCCVCIDPFRHASFYLHAMAVQSCWYFHLISEDFHNALAAQITSWQFHVVLCQPNNDSIKKSYCILVKITDRTTLFKSLCWLKTAFELYYVPGEAVWMQS